LNNLSLTKSSVTGSEYGSGVLNFGTTQFFNNNLNSKLFTLSSSNQAVLADSKVIRRFANLSPKGSNFNLSQDLNALSADTRFKERFSLSASLGSYYERQQSN
jgi:hypothetical protein